MKKLELGHAGLNVWDMRFWDIGGNFAMVCNSKNV